MCQSDRIHADRTRSMYVFGDMAGEWVGKRCNALDVAERVLLDSIGSSTRL
jgi:hypothetical protein